MRAWCLVLLLGCYHPAPQLGAPCDSTTACPSGQECAGGHCALPGTTSDSSEDSPPPIVDVPTVDAAIDARMIDARMIDAPPDAANLSGCADGTREAFVDPVTFPNIAGCGAVWQGAMDLRAPASGIPCGNASDCNTPADACAAGWHICGTGGDPAELSSKMSNATCLSPPGRYVMAMQHCTTFGPCVYDVPFGCAPSNACSEPVCCGSGCITTQGCTGAVYPMTGIGGSIGNGCGALLASETTGVLCCH